MIPLQFTDISGYSVGVSAEDIVAVASVYWMSPPCTRISFRNQTDVLVSDPVEKVIEAWKGAS